MQSRRKVTKQGHVGNVQERHCKVVGIAVIKIVTINPCFALPCRFRVMIIDSIVIHGSGCSHGHEVS